MVKELEKEGIPTAHITSMSPVAQSIGSCRIVHGIAITNPLSDVELPMAEQTKMRRNFVERALKAISTDISQQTFF